jgi:hypothetical protein
MAHEEVSLDFVKKLGIRGHNGTPSTQSILTLAAAACSLPRSGRQAYFSVRGPGYAGVQYSWCS